MQPKRLAVFTLILALIVAHSQVMAERGGGGRGGSGGRGGAGGGAGGGRSGGGSKPGGSGGRSMGGPGGGPTQHGGGGLGGGLSGGSSPKGSPGGKPHEGGAMGPYGGGTPGARGSQVAGSGLGKPAGGAVTRPGTGTGQAVTAGGARPGTAVSGTATGVGKLPGVGAGRPGVPTDYAGRATGTQFTSVSALNAQATSFHAAAVKYPTYNTAALAGYPAAWHPTNVVTPSLYQHPGYSSLAVGLGLSAKPIPYDYGANVVAQSTAVYVDGDSVATPEQYATQASQIAGNGQSAETAQDSKWLPLGVFALVEGDETQSNDVFQIAVNPQGILRGNYHNVSSNQIESISGSVDKTTQRAAWTIGSDTAPVYEAGIANLTKDVTPILVHTADGQSRQLTLIRLEQSEP